MKYLVVVEGGESSFGAYVPDLPGCIAVASSRSEVMDLIHDAIELHLEDLKDQGLEVPVPHSSPELIDVAA
jgi:predicted RNase H-like HicB family nuclease